jgi:type VII secretion protein EccB
MPSRTDQLHSYQFAVKRVEAALILGTADPGRLPGRRAVLALLAGAVVTALGLAGFAVWGLLQPGGSTRWRSEGVVIVERESGAKYVFLAGLLHPVSNYSSALLIIGAARPNTVWVARRSLAGVTRGAPLGIDGAPDAMPGRRDLVKGPWSVCGRPDQSTVVLAGVRPTGGAAVESAAMLVRVADGTTYLLWHGSRARLSEPDVLRAILVWGPPVPVAAGLVGALPVLPDLGRIPVAGRGQPFLAIPGARIGQVFVVDGRQQVVALAGGLAPIDGLQAALLLGDPATVELARQKAATPLSAGEYAAAPKATLLGNWAGLPADLPPLTSIAPNQAVCRTDDGRLVVGPAVPGGPVVGPDRPATVLLAPGRGAVVEVLSAPDAGSGVLHLVTDAGIRYPVPSVEVLAMLGYSGIAPTQLSAEVAALIPAGPALDPQAARTPLSG